MVGFGNYSRNRTRPESEHNSLTSGRPRKNSRGLLLLVTVFIIVACIVTVIVIIRRYILGKPFNNKAIVNTELVALGVVISAQQQIERRSARRTARDPVP